MNIFIGLDDTDNSESPGKGFHARILGHSLAEAGLFRMRSVTWQQLLTERRIPFTSHNTNACVTWVWNGNISDLIDHARKQCSRVTTGNFESGRHRVEWNGTGSNGQRLAPGICCILLNAGGVISVQKVVVMP
jgi:hypothetical protein